MHPEDVLGCTPFPALSKSVFIKYKYKYMIGITFGTNTIQKKDTNALRGCIRVHYFSGTEQVSFYQMQMQYKICIKFGTNTMQKIETNAPRGCIRVHYFSGTEQASFYQIQMQYKYKYKCT